MKKNDENILDLEMSVPDWPRGGLYTHPSLEIPIIYHTDISLHFCVFYFKQDILSRDDFQTKLLEIDALKPSSKLIFDSTVNVLNFQSR